MARGFLGRAEVAVQAGDRNALAAEQSRGGAAVPLPAPTTATV
jgi:hypothetical protein